MRHAPFLLYLVIAAAPVAAQLHVGTAAAVSGDTLEMGGQVIRLAGIDAPVPAQTCQRDAAEWKCGADARAALAEAVAGEAVECTQLSVDSLGRVIARCRTERHDLADMMLRRGLAVVASGTEDIPAQAAARATRQGLWAATFEAPAAFRARDAAWLAYESRLRRARQQAATVSARSASSGYSGCREVWARLGRPLYRGEPGYRQDMDGDGDGVACEVGPNGR